MNQPVQTSSSHAGNLNQINAMMSKFSQEQMTKTFRQAGGNAIITGRLPYTGGYGSLYYDSDNVPRIIIGILPDGTLGIVSTKEGVNILDDISW